MIHDAMKFLSKKERKQLIALMDKACAKATKVQLKNNENEWDDDCINEFVFEYGELQSLIQEYR